MLIPVKLVVGNKVTTYGEWEPHLREPMVNVCPAWLIAVLVHEDPFLCVSNTPAACTGFPWALDEIEQLPCEDTLCCSCAPLIAACWLQLLEFAVFGFAIKNIPIMEIIMAIIQITLYIWIRVRLMHKRILYNCQRRISNTFYAWKSTDENVRLYPSDYLLPAESTNLYTH